MHKICIIINYLGRKISKTDEIYGIDQKERGRQRNIFSIHGEKRVLY
jgi:hypothetical protein